MNTFRGIKFIGKGTVRSEDNPALYELDKEMLEDLDHKRPAGGYPKEQEEAIEKLREDVKRYEERNMK